LIRHYTENDPPALFIAGWRQASKRAFDLGVATAPWGSGAFVESLGIGLLTRTMSGSRVADAPDPIAAGRRLLLEHLARHVPQDLMVTMDGEDLSGRYVLLEAMNTRYVGSNLHLAPAADPGDGLLDLVLLRDGEQEKLERYLSRSSREDAIEPEWTIRKGRQFQFSYDGCDIHMDDKRWPDSTSAVSAGPGEIQVTVQRHALSFLLPAAVAQEITANRSQCMPVSRRRPSPRPDNQNPSCWLHERARSS
jgi:diacylglycerol kinase family enzyme